jgi:hypothetical protein
VAVVALLKDLGTDKAIGTLIEGESLLNDGSAVVLYVVIMNWISHTNSDSLPSNAQDNYPGAWVDLMCVQSRRPACLICPTLPACLICRACPTLLRLPDAAAPARRCPPASPARRYPRALAHSCSRPAPCSGLAAR